MLQDLQAVCFNQCENVARHKHEMLIMGGNEKALVYWQNHGNVPDGMLRYMYENMLDRRVAEATCLKVDWAMKTPMTEVSQARCEQCFNGMMRCLVPQRPVASTSWRFESID
ncbi:unnamed protein product [Symbiodinium natans]|uniref:Uncharacterized protein n=1 Tax=Symbiodinium natans TaxID=878477 RepID=A0A812KAV4_9DINO|nr:unnamed protein product [Symbiodinium natans]